MVRAIAAVAFVIGPTAAQWAAGAARADDQAVLTDACSAAIKERFKRPRTYELVEPIDFERRQATANEAVGWISVSQRKAGWARIDTEPGYGESLRVSRERYKVDPSSYEYMGVRVRYRVEVAMGRILPDVATCEGVATGDRSWLSRLTIDGLTNDEWRAAGGLAR